MDQSKPNDSGIAFAGNLERASLLAGELATRRASSQQTRDATLGAGVYPQAGGAIIYQRGDGARALGNLTHMNRGVERDWWHWPAVFAVAVIGLIMLLSDSGLGDDISLMLRDLI